MSVTPPPESFLTEGETGRLHEAARDRLRLTIERIETLEEEKAEIAGQIKEVYGEAKAVGYNVKVLRAIVKRRKIDRDDQLEFEAVLETYLDALGELS